jgi:hypothetical protein
MHTLHQSVQSIHNIQIFIYLFKKYTHKHTHTNIFLFNRVNKMRVY